LEASEHILACMRLQLSSPDEPMMVAPLALGIPIEKFGVCSGGSTASTDAGSPASRMCFSDDELDLKPEGNTSVIIKNMIPNCSQQLLIDILHSHDFLADLDFIYVPMAFNEALSFQYAFLNFVDPSRAQEFRKSFTGFNSWRGLGMTDGGCRIEWSDIQGLDAHVNRYRNSPMMHASVGDEYKPILLQAGVRVAFPAPTKQIHKPQLRRRKNR